MGVWNARTRFSVPEFLILYFPLLYTMFYATILFSLFFFNKTPCMKLSSSKYNRKWIEKLVKPMMLKDYNISFYEYISDLILQIYRDLLGNINRYFYAKF